MRATARTRIGRGFLSAVLLSAFVGRGDGQAAVTVERAGDWEAVFDRSAGWTGADGIYSIPVSERDTFGSGLTRTLFVFSDTFIGGVGADGTRRSGSTLVNNTLGLLDFLNKKLLVARVTPAGIASFEAWRFWDGARWVADPSRAAPVADRVSSELSVTPLPDGRYVLVFQLDGLGRDVAARVGASPVGPFGPAYRLWSCPEADLGPDVYCYNAKAHPSLSRPGELLISYNVNSFNLADNLANADIYRPRFIRVRMAPFRAGATTRVEGNVTWRKR